MTQEEKREYNKRYRESHREQFREYSKKWRVEHPERRKEQQKNYRDSHKEKIDEYKREHIEDIKKWQQSYQENNKERLKEYHHNYYLENKDIIKDRTKRYIENNPEKIAEYKSSKKYRARTLLAAYDQKDSKRGFDISGNITEDWIIENIFNGQSCVYCGEDDWRKLGTDRIDNSKPHTPDNVVCCCGKCNVKRNKHYTVEEFKDKVTECK